MDILNFAFRLLKHGSIFLLRLLGIGLGVASVVAARSYSQDEEKTPFQKYHEASYEVEPDGSVYYHDEY